MKAWRASATPAPVEGIEEAIRVYWAADKRISLYVLGDEFTGDSIPAGAGRGGRGQQAGLGRPPPGAHPRRRLPGGPGHDAVYKHPVFGINAADVRAEQRYVRRHHALADMPRHGMRTHVRLALGAAASLARSRACGGVQIKPEPALPKPLVQTIPTRVGLVVPGDMRNFQHTETRWGVDWTIALGDGHAHLMRDIFKAEFDQVQEFADLDAARAAPGLKAVFEPRIEQYSFVTARETGGRYYAVTIRYRINLYTPERRDRPIASRSRATAMRSRRACRAASRWKSQASPPCATRPPNSSCSSRSSPQARSSRRTKRWSWRRGGDGRCRWHRHGADRGATVETWRCR